MKKFHIVFVFLLGIALLQGCSSAKVLNSWKAEKPVIDDFKQKNILVIARTADNKARIAFEKEIAGQMISRGFRHVTESFKKIPDLHPEREMTEKRMNLIKTLLDSEGYDGIVLTAIKDKNQTTTVEQSGVYVGASYGYSYPGYYGGFYNYYATPYAYGPYYSSVGTFVPTSTTTRTRTEYVLETVAYNLDAPDGEQLVSVITISLDDPKDAYKAAAEYVESAVNSLDK